MKEKDDSDSDSGDYDEFIASLSEPTIQTDTAKNSSNRRGKRDKIQINQIKKKTVDIDTPSSLLGRVVANSNEEDDSSNEECDIAKERAIERRVETRRKSRLEAKVSQSLSQQQYMSNVMGWSSSTPETEEGDADNTPDPKPTTHGIDINDTLGGRSDPDPTARSIFDDAREFISFNPVMRIVIWLYSERKMVLLACSHLVATLIIWSKLLYLSDIMILFV